MNKKRKLSLCNWTLLAFTAAILASGIQLEALHGESVSWVIVHIGVGLGFVGLVLRHVWLHFGRRNWFVAFSKMKKPVTRILWWLYLLTAITGVVALVHWGGTLAHSPLGGVHGKIGFLMLLLAIAHIGKRYRYFTK